MEEVDEYDFFVLYKKDEAGLYTAQGYWTKNRERQWSLNTMLIFPHCQKNGFGGLMIGLSYLILKVSGEVGSPETPLSDKGRESFEKFWKISIVKYLRSAGRLSLEGMSLATGIAKEDLLRAMRLMNMIKKNSEHEVFFESPDIKKVENLERRLLVERQLLVEKSLKLEGWPEQEPAELEK